MSNQNTQTIHRDCSNETTGRTCKPVKGLKAEFNLLETQKEAAAPESDVCIIEYDNSQALGNLHDETEDPLQRVQDFVDIQHKIKEKLLFRLSLVMTHQRSCNYSGIELAITNVNTSPAVLPTDKSTEVTLFTDQQLAYENNAFQMRSLLHTKNMTFQKRSLLHISNKSTLHRR